ncbi:hypothetical protein B0T11DRAFT_314439 [Plectosphaerella cucumerina]|uniref:Uncharacterized protein n=1 Tax=Plectosphaerella cucumerina TaxID=40658 RepID=A0A8K0X8P4_9PEZI|nr:hypothetical protein B0T11DRAFT_314439 [Plectosphaerella cucumerina]
MSILSDKQFREQVESGQLAVDTHNLLLRIALIYLLDHKYVLSNAVKELHSRGWSFEAFHIEYQGLLYENVWKEHYTPAYLAQASTARFWRLPNLWDRTDTSNPLRAVPRRKGTGQFTKLPRWAYLVTRTHWRQPTLSKATITEIAMFTLQVAIPRQQMYSNGPDIQLYSKTQVQFWLDQMGMNRTTVRLSEELWDLDCLFGSLVAQGVYDVRRWEAYYSRERWESMEARRRVLEPDLDRNSEMQRCRLPDGRLMGDVSETGWEEELGSEEEIVFLAAVGAREVELLASERAEAVTTKAPTTAGNDPKYAVRSYILLEVLRAAFETDRARYLDNLKQRVMDAGRLDSSTVAPWMNKVLEIMEPYAAERTPPTDLAGWIRLLRMVLEENGQLFGRWKLMGGQNPFQLGPRRDLIHRA